MPDFLEPSRLERMFNRAFGALVGLGLGLRHNYLIEVRGHPPAAFTKVVDRYPVFELIPSG
ncbi:MAG: hypothetical protein ACREKS_23280 [Candidatus Rokuibacteriota bacterium]